MRLACDGGRQILARVTDGQAGRRVADLLDVLKVAMGVASLTFCGGAEHGRYIVLAFDVCLCSEIQIATIGLGFSGECRLQIVQRFAVLQFHGCGPVALDG